MSRADGAIAELLSDVQRARAGLLGWPTDRFRDRFASLQPDLARTGLSRLVEEMIADQDTPDISSAYIDLDTDEPGRRASYGGWQALGELRLPALWAWFERVRAAATPLEPWWFRDLTVELPADTIGRLRGATAPLAPLGPIVERWAARAGLERPTEYNWRWLSLGRGLGISVPAFADLLPALVRRFRELDLLPLGHRVQVIRQPKRSSMVVPVRVPGHSILFVPVSSEVTPLSVQYLQHELAHLAEHALRPPDATLRERWTFDPVRSEGWALFFESLLQDPGWLARLGVDSREVEPLAEFLREENELTKGLMAADLALDGRLASASDVEEARRAAREIAAELAIEWSPEIMLFRIPRTLYWRTCVAGWAWKDAAVAVLASRFGPAWADRPDAWQAVRAALAAVGSASDALECLAGHPVDPASRRSHA